MLSARIKFFSREYIYDVANENIYLRGLQNFSMEGHIADILKTGGPKLTQIRQKVTVSNVRDRVVLLEK